jgi:predicted DNA-binding transcriptional regulator YafY
MSDAEDGMAKKRAQQSPPPEPSRPAVTPDRFRRLFRLLGELGTGPKTRDHLTRALAIDVRGFYRDLELVRAVGIGVSLTQGRYALAGGVDDARDRLPFPDPHLSLGEARRLARGKTAPQARLRRQLDDLLA